MREDLQIFWILPLILTTRRFNTVSQWRQYYIPSSEQILYRDRNACTSAFCNRMKTHTIHLSKVVWISSLVHPITKTVAKSFRRDHRDQDLQPRQLGEATLTTTINPFVGSRPQSFHSSLHSKKGALHGKRQIFSGNVPSQIVPCSKLCPEKAEMPSMKIPPMASTLCDHSIRSFGQFYRKKPQKFTLWHSWSCISANFRLHKPIKESWIWRSSQE